MNSLINNNVTLGGAQTITNLKTVDFGGADQNVIIIKDDVASVSETPVSNRVRRIRFNDVNNDRLGEIQSVKYATGNQGVSFIAENSVSGSAKTTTLSAIVDKDGNTYVTAPSSSIANSVVTTKSINNNLYVSLGNGLKIQWNNKTGAASGTITFSTPFSGTVYKVSTSVNAANEPRVIVCDAFTTTGFNFTCYRQNGSGTTTAATPFSWIAIGV